MNRFLGVVLFLGILAPAMSAQDKNQAYYNTHESEILPDARIAFRNGNYERAIELCQWHYIIIGDSAADSLGDLAESCARLMKEMTGFRGAGKMEEAEEAAKKLLSINPDDVSAKRLLEELKKIAEEKAAAEKARKEAEEKAEKERLAAEERAREEAEAKLRAEKEAEEKAEKERLAAEEKARTATDEKELQEIEARLKLRKEAEAILKAQKEAEERAEKERLDAEAKIAAKNAAYDERFKNKGLEQTFSVSYAFETASCDFVYLYSGVRTYGNLHPFEFDYTLSLKLNRVLSIGVGAGVLYNAQSVSIINDEFCATWEGFEEKRADVPVFASLKLRLFRSSVRPLIGATGGYYLLSNRPKAEGNLGLEFRLGRRASVSVLGVIKTIPYPNSKEEGMYGSAVSPGAKVEFSF